MALDQTPAEEDSPEMEGSSEPEQDVEAILAATEALLEQGRESLQQWEEFAKEKGIPEGIGKAVLTDRRMPGRRHVFQSLLHELEHLEEGVEEVAKRLAKQKSPPSQAVGARTAGHRYRI